MWRVTAEPHAGVLRDLTCSRNLCRNVLVSYDFSNISTCKTQSTVFFLTIKKCDSFAGLHETSNCWQYSIDISDYLLVLRTHHLLWSIALGALGAQLRLSSRSLRIAGQAKGTSFSFLTSTSLVNVIKAL